MSLPYAMPNMIYTYSHYYILHMYDILEDMIITPSIEELSTLQRTLD